MTIVKTCADDGKSGLDFNGRTASQNLIAKIESGDPGFMAVLVYDVIPEGLAFPYRLLMQVRFTGDGTLRRCCRTRSSRSRGVDRRGKGTPLAV